MPSHEGYRLRVLDNFHLYDEDEEHQTEPFPSLQAAEERARTMVDRFLVKAQRPGMSAAELYGEWSRWGETPIVLAPDGVPKPAFRATRYAQEAAERLTRDTKS